MATDTKSQTDFEAKLVARAAKDLTFRQQLLADPRTAIEQAFNVTIPGGIQIKVVEETPDTVYLVLPAMSAKYSRELSEADLMGRGAVQNPGRTSPEGIDCPYYLCWTCDPWWV
ncbi:MAG: NHLP leader peptide family RiPP precursor [Chloroflexota bacterium]